MPRRKKSSHESHSRSSLSIKKDKPHQRHAANSRERARMRVLSRAFCRLKTTLPWVPADTKLSKLDTLRLAGSYIAHLNGILKDETLSTSESSLHPAMSLVRTWPFFNRPFPLGGSSTGHQDGNGSDLEDMDEEEEEDNYDYNDDGESMCLLCCTWEETSSLPTKECVHLDLNPSSTKKGKLSNSNAQRSRKIRGKRNNNISQSQMGNKKHSSSSSSLLNKQSSPVQVAPRPLSLEHKLESFQKNESNKNENEMFHLHHNIHNHQQIHIDNSAQIMTMTVTNLENAPPPYLHSQNINNGNDILLGISQNNQRAFEDHHNHDNHLYPHHHQQHEMHNYHHHGNIIIGGGNLVTLE